MQKHWKTITDEADVLLVAGLVDRNNELILSAGRLRGTALLAALEPAEEVLPAVRPLTDKPRQKRRGSPLKRAEMDAVLEKTWARTCPGCGVGPNEACISLRSTSSRRVGETLTYVHAERTGGSRSIKNIPPEVATPNSVGEIFASDQTVWGVVHPTPVG